jgi:RNA polymerase sigma factor (sigma-70 family)
MEQWQARLANGDTGAAWELFLRRYRRLLLATTRRLLRDDGDVFEVFEHLCGRLLEDDLARLRQFHEEPARRARFSTWLVAVAHNLVIDWARHRDGRRRVHPPDGLSPVQQRIFTFVFAEQRSHTETYGMLRAERGDDMSFPSFLREVRETYRVVGQSNPRGILRHLGAGPPQEPATEDGTPDSARAGELAELMGTLDPADRLAVRLFVVEELSAAEVAKAMGWPNAKAVYNRVHRALGRLRHSLEVRGIRREDL